MRINGAIPSWAVGAFGALLIVVSVALGSVYLRYLDAGLNNTEAGLNRLSAYADRRMNQHIQAEGRKAMADVMFALAIGAVRDGNRPDPFLLLRAGESLHAAIRLMWLATPGAEDLEGLASTATYLLIELVDGDLAAYDEMTKILSDQDIRSNEAGREFHKQIAEYETRVQRLHRLADRVRDSQAGLNILGLVIVLLKDLPVWGRRRRAQ